jgi:isoleucyl-tRNA synthetase
LSRIPEADGAFADPKLAVKWDRVFAERGEVLKALEQARVAGLIGHSLDARVTLHSQNGNQDSPLRGMVDAGRKKLEDVLIVSQAELSSELIPRTNEPVSSHRGELLDAVIVVAKAEGNKCERCWKYDVDVGKDADHPTVCPRCVEVLRSGASA